MPLQEEPIDFSDNLCLFFIDGKIPILAPFIAKEPSKRYCNLAVCEPLPYAQVQFSEMLRLSSCASELMMVMSSSPLESNVQIFSFSK